MLSALRFTPLRRALPPRARRPIMASDPEHTRWTEAWRAPEPPRFDAGGPSPALGDLMTRQPALAARANVLVPGCGRGYDVTAFARAGAASAEGWDCVPEAVSAARAWLSTSGAPPTATVHQRDFFVEAGLSNPPQFGLGYDYTFMVALPPARRGEWAAAWAALVAPGGALITLMFPVESGDDAGKQGPPWPVTPDVYRSLLEGEGGGFKCEELAAVPPHLSHRGRGGREWLAVWRKHGGGEAASRL